MSTFAAPAAPTPIRDCAHQSRHVLILRGLALRATLGICVGAALLFAFRAKPITQERTLKGHARHVNRCVAALSVTEQDFATAIALAAIDAWARVPWHASVVVA